MITADGIDITEDLRRFAELIGLEVAAPGRYSKLLLLQLFGGSASGKLNPAKVVHEIRLLEGMGGRSTTKPPEPFRRPPLLGLMHKHYLPDGLHAMARNMLNGIKKDGLPLLDELMRQAKASGREQYVTEQDAKAIAHDASWGNFKRRAEASEMIGEWIVFAEADGAKHYLSLGFHGEDYDHLRASIDTICAEEFPFLKSLLADAPGATK
jgi:hypothetical protein